MDQGQGVQSVTVSDGSITCWLDEVQVGNPEAAQKLWERFFRRLVRLARRELRYVPRRATDEEDVALSAFHSFWRRAADGRFPQLQDRHDLWRLLVLFTIRKASHLQRAERSQKRAGVNAPGAELPARAVLEQIVGTEPTPAFAAQVIEEYQRLLDLLSDGRLQEVAQLKLDGYTNEEIATKLACAPRTIERKLCLIRAIWAKEGLA